MCHVSTRLRKGPSIQQLSKYLRRGKRLIELYATYKGAEEEIATTVKRVAATWLKIEHQLQFMKKVEKLLDDRHRDIQQANAEMLSSKIKVVVQKLESVTISDERPGPEQTHKPVPKVRQLKYTFLKESLDKAIEDLEDWERLANPSWYLMLKIADSQIDQVLLKDRAVAGDSIPSAKAIRGATQEEKPKENHRIFLPESGLEAMKQQDMPFCVARLAYKQSSSSWFILSDVRCQLGANVGKATRDVRDLARKLQHDNTEAFGLLHCKGVVQHIEKSKPNELARFTMVFRTPPHLRNPRSLRERLITDKEAITLSDKIDMARGLAKAVNYVHVFGFVHKNIRPETILVFDGQNSVDTNSTSALFLVGFENFRKEEGQTYFRGDGDWEKNLYRHPSRQGYIPGEEYCMQHDMYSLGVCLLEIGLWTSFVLYDEKGNNPAPALIDGLPQVNTEAPKPEALKDSLLSLARQELPKSMGRRYCQVVETCLTCLDLGNSGFGDASQFVDEDGILVGVRYIDKVSVSNLRKPDLIRLTLYALGAFRPEYNFCVVERYFRWVDMTRSLLS